MDSNSTQSSKLQTLLSKVSELQRTSVSQNDLTDRFNSLQRDHKELVSSTNANVDGLMRVNEDLKTLVNSLVERLASLEITVKSLNDELFGAN
jgi:ABC-type transporter Mla subunit MlaD